LRLNTVRESYKPGDVFTLYPFGDWHLGSLNCDKKLWEETIAEIRDDDKRWKANNVDSSIITVNDLDELRECYRDYICPRIEPIMDKCWGMGDGNHDEPMELTRAILEKLERPELYTGWSCITRVVFESEHNERCSWRIFHSHGWQAGRTKGAKVNQGEKTAAWVDADVILYGHSHDRQPTIVTRLGTNPSFTKVVARDIYVSHCGSFLRTLQQDRVGYAERKGYPPTSLGSIKVRFHPGRDEWGPKKKIEVVV
jgi:hypothetical protein